MEVYYISSKCAAVHFMLIFKEEMGFQENFGRINAFLGTL